MYETKQREGDASAREHLGCGVETTAEQLNVIGKGSMTPTVADRDLVNAVGVEDPKIAATFDRHGTTHTGMVEVDTEAQSFEGRAGEHLPSPLLEKDTVRITLMQQGTS